MTTTALLLVALVLAAVGAAVSLLFAVSACMMSSRISREEEVRRGP